jgi:hypothetical protein
MAFPNARRRAIASIYANKQVANKLIIRYASRHASFGKLEAFAS